MKNSKKLLLTAAMIAIIPSIQLLGEDEPVESVIRTTTIVAAADIEPVAIAVVEEPTEAETKSIQAHITAAINGATSATVRNKIPLMTGLMSFGQLGLAAGAWGSYCFKKTKNNLILSKKITDGDALAEALAPLNKGIKSNRKLMAVSGIAMLPLSAYMTNEISNHRTPEVLVVKFDQYNRSIDRW